jgi:hypothetical protein
MQSKRLFCISALCGLLLLAWHLPAVGGIPHLINYQGKLTDNSGNPLNGTYNITFKIYNAESGGTKLWEETQNGVAVSDGIFSVILGTVNAIDLSFDSQYWLEVMVGAETITPRRRLTSIGYSFRAQKADTAAFTLNYPAHNHDDRYYTETELNTSDGNPPNTGSNRVNWNNITDMPVGFVDGVDNVGGASDTAKFAWRADSLDGHNWGDIYPNADKVDNYDAGNSSGQVSVSNGTLCSNLNADKIDGYDAGNSSGQIPVSNGSLCSNLNSDKWDNYNWGDTYPNADKVDNYHAGNSSGQVAVSNGSLCTSLNADKLDDKDASAFVDLTSTQTIDGTKYFGSFSNTYKGSWAWFKNPSTSAIVAVDGISNGNGLYVINITNSYPTIWAKNNVSNGSNAVYAENTSSGGTTYPTIYAKNNAGSWAGWFVGDLGCTGAKPAVVKTSQGQEALYALEGPDVEFFSSGSSHLENGTATIEFERLFKEAISPDINVRVIVTPTDGCNGIYVSSKSHGGFVAKELLGGTSNASFDWIAIGRRAGYEKRPILSVPMAGEAAPGAGQ